MQIDLLYNDNFGNVQIFNRLAFFLTIWKEGRFQSDIDEILRLTRTESFDKYSKYLKLNGFISIEVRSNPQTLIDENYYHISYDNFKIIFKHICKSTMKDFNNEIFEFLVEDRINITSEMVNKIESEIKANRGIITEDLFYYLEKSFAFFFLFIIQFSPNINLNKSVSVFLHDSISVVQKTIKPGPKVVQQTKTEIDIRMDFSN